MLWPSILAALQSLIAGAGTITLAHWVMITIGCLLLYLGIAKGFEPLLLVPIGFGAILVNIPAADVMGEHGFLRYMFNAGILRNFFRC